MRYRAVVQQDVLIHHHRTGATIDDHLCRHSGRGHIDALDLADEAYTLVRIGRCTHPYLATVRRRGGTRQHSIDCCRQPLRRTEVRRIQLQIDILALSQGHRHFTFDRCSVWNPGGRQVVHGYLGTGTRATRSNHHQIALSHCIDLSVCPLQRGEDQRAALQALGVADRRNGDIDQLSGTGEGRQVGRYHHGGDVFQLQGLGCRQIGPHRRQHVDHALHGKRRLRGLIAGAIQTNHEAMANQLIAAHAGNRRNILDPFGTRRVHEQQRHDRPENHQKAFFSSRHVDHLRMAGMSGRSARAIP